MATLVSLDIGFDRKALPKRPYPEDSSDRHYPLLQFGFTKPDDDGNPVALARRLHKKYRILITLYDLTKDEEKPVEFNELSLNLIFQPARHQDFFSPFADDPSEIVSSESHRCYDRFNIFRGVSGEGHSSVYDNECPIPIWNVYPPGAASKCYPENQLHFDRKPPKMYREIEYRGHFYLTILLYARWNNSHSKTFRVDPEMIVDNNGPGTDPDKGQGRTWA